MLKKFIKKYEGVIEDVGNTPQNKGECVGLVQLWIAKLGLKHCWGNAKDIFANASTNEYEKVENAPDIYPDEGDIICWNSTMGNGFGHIAIVISSDPEKDTVEVFESNNPYGEPPRKHTYSNWRGIIGWLKPYVLEGEENDPPELTEECLKHKEDVEVLLEAKEALETSLEASREDNNTLVKKINDLDKKYENLEKEHAEEVKLLTEQRTKYQKEDAEFRKTVQDVFDENNETLKDLEERVLNLQKPERSKDMNRITKLWENLPKTIKVFCFLALSTLLSELAIELGVLSQTFLVRISAQLINLLLVGLEQGVPEIKARLSK